MSNSTELQRILDSRNLIRSTLVSWGVAANTDLIDDLATKLSGVTNNGAIDISIAEGQTYIVPSGYHDGSGTVVCPKVQKSLTPYAYDFNSGYQNSSSWVYQNPTNTYVDIYTIVSGHVYFVGLGSTVGSRFRIIYTTTDMTELTSGSISGTSVIYKNNPSPYDYATFTAKNDAYLAVSKDNQYVTGLKSYVYDITELHRSWAE